MDQLNLALLAIGGLTLLLSLIAGLIHDRIYFLSEPLVAVILGVAVGPAGVDLLSLSAWGDPFHIIEQAARLTVGLAVMGAALRLPQRYFQEHVTAMTVVLLPGMLGMWVVSSGLIYLLLAVEPWVALLVGAVVTPTDPVLAGTIVTGHTARENIPGPVRNLLTGESGANDGLAYLFVFLPILVLEHPIERALTDWVFVTLLWEVALAVILGAVIGSVTGYVEKESSEHDALEETSLLSVTVALTFAVLGGVKLLGSEGILAAFVAGLAFNRFAEVSDEADEQKIQETVLRLFTFPVFVIFGIAIPWEQWVALGWVGPALVVAILLLRRVPVLFSTRRLAPQVGSTRDALFVGWFGPIGIAALFYAVVSYRILGYEIIWPTVSLVIAGSTLVHGITSTPFSKWYGRVTDGA